MTVTVEQLTAAGVGREAAERYVRAQGGPATRTTPRRTARTLAAAPSGPQTGTGEGRGAGLPLVLRLDGRVASAKNSTKRLQLGTRTITAKSDAAQRWMQAAVAQLAQQRPRHHEPIAAPVRVVVVLHGPITHPWSVDGDNGQSACWDALVKARILADDKPRIVRAWGGEWRPASAWSAEITITPYGGPADGR